MFLHSIRWRLQLWYGLILVAVLAGFGFTAFTLERSRQFRNLDDQLTRRLGALANGLGAPPRRGAGPEGRPGRPPPGQSRPDFPADGPPDEDGPSDHPPRPGAFHLPPRAAALFDETDTNSFYYVIWTRDGRELTRSANVPASVVRPQHFAGHENPPPKNRDLFREVSLTTPPGETLLVGRTVVPELAESRRVAWSLAGVGGGVLILGLAGGWWLASRAIRPIQGISATAVKISAGDLSQRIDTVDTENELGQLAAVLNSTFARLEAAFAQQKQFTSDAAHELRTPVSVMLTQTQGTLNRERTAAEYRETVEACQRAAQRMRRLIESLLELARLDAGQEQMKRMTFGLSQMVSDAVEMIQPLALERGVKVHADVDSIECTGDSERLGQVVTNLLTNAIHYNKPNGEVRVTGRARNGSVVLSVADTGQGISAEDLPHVFKRFYRADKSRTVGRTGLGLSISKAIVEAHGGKIEVISEAGAGTTFTMELPA